MESRINDITSKTNRDKSCLCIVQTKIKTRECPMSSMSVKVNVFVEFDSITIHFTLLGFITMFL